VRSGEARESLGWRTTRKAGVAVGRAEDALPAWGSRAHRAPPSGASPSLLRASPFSTPEGEESFDGGDAARLSVSRWWVQHLSEVFAHSPARANPKRNLRGAQGRPSWPSVDPSPWLILYSRGVFPDPGILHRNSDSNSGQESFPLWGSTTQGLDESGDTSRAFP
jgi:hypothetical protein